MEENTVQRGMAAPQNLARMEVGVLTTGGISVQSAATALLPSLVPAKGTMVPFAKKKTIATASLVETEETV